MNEIAVEDDLSLIRLIQTVQDAHQRRLAGAVLSEEAVDFALADAQINAITRHNAGKALDDSTKVDNTANSSAQDYPFLPSRLRCLYET